MKSLRLRFIMEKLVLGNFNVLVSGYQRRTSGIFNRKNGLMAMKERKRCYLRNSVVNFHMKCYFL